MIGIDVGGTFTDIIVQDKENGKIMKQYKVATTPKNPEKAIIDSLISELSTNDRKKVQQIYHATTIATNAFLGQVYLDLPKTALITTKGFRDVLEIGRQRRAALYNLFFQRPTPIIPRRYRYEITERINHAGGITVPLANQELKIISEKIKSEEITSLAICLLHSYKNNSHEKVIQEYFIKNHPNLYVSTSYEVSPEHREFERTSTTAINALLMPLVTKYVTSLAKSFTEFGINAPLFIMQSNGGVSRMDLIQTLPVSIIESGPSAGVVASRFYSEFLQLPKVLSFDMGGTTAKAGTIVDYKISLTSEYEVGGEVHSGRITKGSGYPARFPFIDLAEISSGGGSIAWVDKGKALHVGPISAGADPGPACYDKGGTEPTITDANLYLGRLNPKGLLNQTFPIDTKLAKQAIQSKVAKLLDINLIDAALGIIKIANNNMSRILRIVTVERGLDPREFTLLAFGGAGPLHGCSLADELGIKEILIPQNPGLFSTMGLLYTDVKHTHVKSIRKKLADINYTELENHFQKLEEKGNELLKEEGFDKKSIVHQRSIDARYSSQGFELLIPLSDFDLTQKGIIQDIETRFHEKHQSIYGYIMEDETIEIVNIRTNSLGLMEKQAFTKITKGQTKPPENSLVETREVLFDNSNDYVETPIFDRSLLLANNQIKGPAIIEQYDTTTIIPSIWLAKIDEYGLIQLLRKDKK
ncbi:MAG: hydantoinase/oxoprolinase family protein [Asgard group archaeon]|nr:hydantoinase/oxoprolinase family protein [Asgard group archaeon]